MPTVLDLTNDPLPTADDLLYFVGDPLGVPVNRKATVAALAASDPFQFPEAVSGTGIIVGPVVPGPNTVTISVDGTVALLSGRAGGQTLSGGTGATDGLKLQPNSVGGSAGAIQLADWGQFVTVGPRVGTTNPFEVNRVGSGNEPGIHSYFQPFGVNLHTGPAGARIGRWAMHGFDGTAYSNSAVVVDGVTAAPWVVGDHASAMQLRVIPKGATAVVTAASARANVGTPGSTFVNVDQALRIGDALAADPPAGVALDLVTGGLAMRESVFVMPNANVNDLVIPNGTSNLVIDCTAMTAGRNITGFAAPANGKFMIVTMVNMTFAITFTHQDAASVAANRIRSTNGINLSPNVDDGTSIVAFLYVTTLARWVPLLIRA